MVNDADIQGFVLYFFDTFTELLFSLYFDSNY